MNFPSFLLLQHSSVCTNFTLTKTGNFVCDRETRRIPISNLCNANQTAQCIDRTDISFCLCDKNKWSCADQSKCIDAQNVCNKRVDISSAGLFECDDGSDEDSLMCKTVWTCTEGFILIEGDNGHYCSSSTTTVFICLLYLHSFTTF